MKDPDFEENWHYSGLNLNYTTEIIAQSDDLKINMLGEIPEIIL